MSRAFRSPTLKSSALVTLPEGKQTVRPTHIHRHWRPHSRDCTWMSPNREFILLSLILPNFQIWVWEAPWDVTGRGNPAGEATGGLECWGWGPPAPKGCRVWPPPALEEDSHATENALGESPLKKSLFGRPAAISSPLKFLSPALETHLSVAAPYYALCMQTVQHRATEFGHEPGEQSLQTGEGMNGSGVQDKAALACFSVGIKTFFKSKNRR